MIKPFRWKAFTLALAASLTLAAGDAFAQGKIKIAYTDPLSGPFAQVGDQNVQQLKYIIDWVNGRGGALGHQGAGLRRGAVPHRRGVPRPQEGGGQGRAHEAEAQDGDGGGGGRGGRGLGKIVGSHGDHAGRTPNSPQVPTNWSAPHLPVSDSPAARAQYVRASSRLCCQ